MSLLRFISSCFLPHGKTAPSPRSAATLNREEPKTAEEQQEQSNGRTKTTAKPGEKERTDGTAATANPTTPDDDEAPDREEPARTAKTTKNEHEDNQATNAGRTTRRAPRTAKTRQRTRRQDHGEQAAASERAAKTSRQQHRAANRQTRRQDSQRQAGQPRTKPKAKTATTQQAPPKQEQKEQRQQPTRGATSKPRRKQETQDRRAAAPPLAGMRLAFTQFFGGIMLAPVRAYTDNAAEPAATGRLPPGRDPDAARERGNKPSNGGGVGGRTPPPRLYTPPQASMRSGGHICSGRMHAVGCQHANCSYNVADVSTALRMSLLRCGCLYSVAEVSTASRMFLQRRSRACNAVGLLVRSGRLPFLVAPSAVRSSSVFCLVPVSCSVVALSTRDFCVGIAKTRCCLRCLWNVPVFCNVPTFCDALFFWKFPFVWEVPLFLECFRKYIRTNFYPALRFSEDADSRLMSGNPT